VLYLIKKNLKGGPRGTL